MTIDVTGTCRDFAITPETTEEEKLRLGARLAAHDMLAKFAVDFRADVDSAGLSEEMIESAMKHEPAARATLRLLLAYLRELLADELGQACSDLLPAPMTKAVLAVVCPRCYRKADVRALLRLGHRHSPFELRRLEDRPEHYARLAAALVGTVINHRTDPLAVVEHLDRVVYPWLGGDAF